MEKIQHKISKYMIQNGITIAHVARMTGIDYEMLRRSLRENRVLTADELVAILTSTTINLTDVLEQK